MERATKSRMTAGRRPEKAQRGASIVEAVIALPILLAVILGAIQFALIYEAKATLNHASLQAARLGAVRNADPEAIRRGLARGLAALHSPESSLAALARMRMNIETDLATDARIRILNPTREAFDDFAVDVDGEREIPNDRLHARSTSVGAQSGINIQDANLLKVQITYGYELHVPLVNWFIARVLLGVGSDMDVFEQQLLRRTRLPIVATATVRMQSPARLSDLVIARSELPDLERIPSDAAPSSTGDEDEEGGPAEDDSSHPSPDEQNDGSGLDEGFMGFGGDPSGGPVPDADGEAGNGGDGSSGSGGGVNGGNPQQCAIDDDQPEPFPFDQPGESSPLPRDMPWFPAWTDASGAIGSEASIASVSLASLSVGNPIHVATGNKFQTEIDVDALPGALSIAFQRHYNSSAVNDPSVVGAGWRHSYQATLRQRTGRIEIVQGDGRQIAFTQDKENRPPQTKARFVSQRASDGVLIASDDSFRWRWRSGRELVFDAGGRLVRIVDHGRELVLRYDEDALISVTDPENRELRFEYFSNGRLAKVRGPGGAGAAYAYDSDGNLVQVTSTDGRARRYTYDDERHPHHLSSISLGNVRPEAYGERKAFERVASWAYDDRGRAVYSSHPDDAGKVSLAFHGGYTDVTDAFGRTTRYVIGWRQGVAYVSEVRGPGCGSCGLGDVRYAYDDRFQPLTIDKKHSPTLHYRYDDDARLVQIDREISGRREWVARYSYVGSTSRVSRIERPSVKADAAAVVELEYSVGDRLRRVRELGFSPDAGGYRQIVREVNVSYDQQGRMLRVDGPRTDVNDSTEFEYDDVGRVVATKTPAGETRVLDRDAAGRPTRIAQTGRPELKLTYDTHGRVISAAQLRVRGAMEVSFSYDHAGRLVQVVDAQGRRTRYGFDAAGRPNRMTSSASDVKVTARYASDDRIERIAAFGANGQLLRTLYYAYDAERRLTELRDGDGQPLRQLHHTDADMLPDRMTDPLGNDTSLAYDGMGRLVSSLAPDGGLTRVERDSFGRTTQVTAPNDARTSYLYDDFGRRVEERSADRGTTKYTYDPAGNLIEKTDARGATTRLNYDAANRVIEVARAEGVSTLRYVDGRLAQVDGEFADERYDYDRDGQLIAHRRTIEGRTYTTRFDYDVRGRLMTRELPSGARLRYRYASNGALQAIEQQRWLGDRVIVRTQDAGSARPTRLAPLGSFVFGNGVTMRSLFDDRAGTLTGRNIDGVASLVYRHDAADRIESLSRDGEVREYRYDAVGRLTSARTTAAREDVRHAGIENASVENADVRNATAEHADVESADVEYSYDVNGNRVSISSPSPAERGRVGERAVPNGTVYQYAPSTNRLISTNSKTRYTYDASGNPIAIGARRYEYDTSGRPTKLFESDRLIAEYRYNFWGERVQKVVHANGKRAVTIYIYEQQKLIAEADERGNITREYVYLDHHPVAMLERSRTYWIHTDHLGTPIAVTNDGRKTIWRTEYQPFGDAQIEADPDGDSRRFTLNLRFPGQYADAESGTSYNYFRDYDPQTGRYLTADPIGLNGGVNPFVYVHANPVSRMDSLGLYQQDVHYYMTLFLAITAGVDPREARHMALASAFLDENPTTRPVEPGSIPTQIGSVTSNQEALVRYHFVLADQSSGQTLRAYRNNNIHQPIYNPSPQMLAMRDYFTTSPVFRPGAPNCSVEAVHLQFFGEYLHAFADTFSHRDQNDRPYDAWYLELGVGHGFHESMPDYTYSDDEWQSRESRTFSMELALREQIRASQFANPERSITDRQLDLFFGALHDFNGTREDEQNTASIRLVESADERWLNSEKIRILNQALLDLGYAGVDLSSSEFRFDQDLARRRRAAAFENLDPSRYPGAILATH